MPRTAAAPHPVVGRLLRALGENIRLARLRRGFSMELVAERAGMSRATLRAVENGGPGVNLGSYANVLHSLGLHQDLSLVARDDELGRKLQDAQLTVRRRAPKRKTAASTKTASTKTAASTKPAAPMKRASPAKRTAPTKTAASTKHTANDGAA